MIPREVFERRRVLLQAERVRAFLDRQLRRGASELALGDRRVSRSEMAALRERLDNALATARKEPRAAHGTPEAYMPRDPTLANLQSLAANQLTLNAPLEPVAEREHAASRLEAAAADSAVASYEGVAASAEGGVVTSAAAPVTALSVAEKIDDALSPRSGDESPSVPRLTADDDYGPDDPIWLTIGLAEAWRRYEDLLGLRIPFNEAPATARLGERVRLFLVGDWGSGTERAGNVAAAIRAQLTDADSRERDCHVIHLGDTYVAGWWWEQELHVIRLWPAGGVPDATSWALPGNHDYYSGTFGFFDWLLGDPLFTNQQANGRPTSLFELTNEQWCVLGLDSSYIDHDLPPQEVAWLRSALERARHAGQKVILLSHHQPWSGFGDGPNPPLWKRLFALWSWVKAIFSGRRADITPLWEKAKPLLQSRAVEAWFWGHEHRFALYDSTAEILRPRLLGNGGIPSPVTDDRYYRHHSDASAIVFDYEVPLPQDSQWCQFAFARVDLDPGGLSESYFDEFGHQIST